MKNKLFSILLVLTMLLPNMAVAYADTEFEDEIIVDSSYAAESEDEIIVDDSYLAEEEDEYALMAADVNFSGSGTEQDPFLISTASDLTKLATLTNNANDKTAATEYASKYYQLTADIDMTGIDYKPISYATNMYTAQGSAFKGTLDGNGHIIRNVNMTTSIAQYGATYGIIGYLGPNGVVKNLGVENMTVNGGNTKSRLCIGGIAGSLSAPITIESCYVSTMTVTVNTTSLEDKTTYAGGITGRTIGNSGTIKNCYTTGLDFGGVTHANNKAGIMGSCGSTGYSAQNCYTTDAKTQGGTSAANSYMSTTNCYTLSTVANATAEALGGAFKENPTVKNDGYPLLAWESTDGYDLKEEEEVEDPYFVGKGTQEEPFEIDSAEMLSTLATLTNTVATSAYASKYYKLTADIDMMGVNYTPISFARDMSNPIGAAFSGTFDGNNHVIKNVNMTSSIAQYGATYGIIGYLGANGVVKNLGVENVTIDGGNAKSRLCIGGIAGALNASVLIENCYVRTMTVTVDTTSLSDTTTYAGGITGRTLGSSGTIKNCYTTGIDFGGVTHANNKAGIMGSCGNAGYSAQNCYTTDAKIQGGTSAANSYMSATNCYQGEAVNFLTADVLGEAFEEDEDLLNNGMPVLVWEYDIAHPETVYYTVKSGDDEVTDGTADVLAKTPIVITFDRAMNTDTFSKIQVLKGDTKLNDCVFEVQSETVLSIQLNAEYNTVYTIIIPKTLQSVRDESGKSAKADAKKITFRTEAMPKAIRVESIKINGQDNAPSNLAVGTLITVEAVVENASELASQSAALVVALFGQDGVMKYAALDTAMINDTEETLTVEFSVPQNAGTNPTVKVMVWDSITKMNAMR